MGEVAYEMELPHHMHMKHPIFHMSYLKRCRLDADHLERAKPSRGPVGIMDKPGLELDNILSYKTTGISFHMKQEYLVKWKMHQRRKSGNQRTSFGEGRRRSRTMNGRY